MTLTADQENAKINAKVMIGRNALCHMRQGKRKVKFFVTDTCHGDAIVSDVSIYVARVTGCKRDKDGWVIAPNVGYDPAVYLCDLYDEIMERGKRNHYRL